MTTAKPQVDATAVLGAYARDPSAFTKAHAAASRAAAAILQAQVQESDLAGLKGLVALVGQHSVEAVLQGMTRPGLVKIVQRISPRPPVGRAETVHQLLTKVLGWMFGQPPAAPPPPLKEVTLEALRKLRATEGFDFEGWISEGRRDLVETVRRMDPHLPGRITAGVGLLRLKALADGAEPMREHDLTSVDEQGLSDAYANLGDAFFTLWASKYDVAALRKALARLDPHRHGIQRMNRRDALAFVTLLAKGEGKVEDPAAPLEEIRFPRPDFSSD